MAKSNYCVISMIPIVINEEGIPVVNGVDRLFLFKRYGKNSKVWIVEEYYTPWLEFEITLENTEKYFWILKEIK